MAEIYAKIREWAFVLLREPNREPTVHAIGYIVRHERLADSTGEPYIGSSLTGIDLEQRIVRNRRGKVIVLIGDALRPPEPQLLDTCVLQNLDWVDRQLEEKERVVWDDAALLQLSERYGSDTANDLVDLGILYKQFEYFGGYPWLVCEANSSEASVFGGNRGVRLRGIVRFFGGHQEDVHNHAFPGVALGLLGGSKSLRISPLIAAYPVVPATPYGL